LFRAKRKLKCVLVASVTDNFLDTLFTFIKLILNLNDYYDIVFNLIPKHSNIKNSWSVITIGSELNKKFIFTTNFHIVL